jgi:hypothetical protein
MVTNEESNVDASTHSRLPRQSSQQRLRPLFEPVGPERAVSRLSHERQRARPAFLGSPLNWELKEAQYACHHMRAAC